MSEDDYNFDETDMKIAVALEHKGLKIPSVDISMDEASAASPLPESLQDSTSLAMRIIAMAEEEERQTLQLARLSPLCSQLKRILTDSPIYQPQATHRKP